MPGRPESAWLKVPGGSRAGLTGPPAAHTACSPHSDLRLRVYTAQLCPPWARAPPRPCVLPSPADRPWASAILRK